MKYIKLRSKLIIVIAIVFFSFNHTNSYLYNGNIINKDTNFLNYIRSISIDKISELISFQKKQELAEKIKKINKKKSDLLAFNVVESYPTDFDISNAMKYKRIQERSLSCELSAAADIVSSLGDRDISETFIIEQVAKSYYNQPQKIMNGKIIWGNPNAGYVGYIDKLPSGVDAKQYNATGYGVLEKPIADIFTQLKYRNKVITEYDYNESYNQEDHLQEVIKSLLNGNMVQLWGDFCTDPRYEDTKDVNHCNTFNSDRTMIWYYEENGQLIKHEGLVGEHAFYLLGYKGGFENPSHIIVWDTKTGRHVYPINEWLRKWNLMQNRSIIVYKNQSELTQK